MKAFPLDSMGMNTLLKDEKGQATFERRQQAMMRLYEKRLGARTLPGGVG